MENMPDLDCEEGNHTSSFGSFAAVTNTASIPAVAVRNAKHHLVSGEDILRKWTPGSLALVGHMSSARLVNFVAMNICVYGLEILRIANASENELLARVE